MAKLALFYPPRTFCRLPLFAYARALILLTILAFAPLRGFAQSFDKAKYFKSRLEKTAQDRPRRASNGFYTIVMEDVLGAGVGLYSVRTGPRHPITDKLGEQDLLAGASKDLSGTSYTTIRSYRTLTDYVQTEFAQSPSGFHAVWLDSLFINDSTIVPPEEIFTPILDGDDTTGFQTLYHLPGLPRDDPRFAIQDALQITQIVNVRGKTFDDSWVEVTTIVKNTGEVPATIGIRYLWDLNIANDDGPILRQRGGEAFAPNEQTLAPGEFAL